MISPPDARAVDPTLGFSFGAIIVGPADGYSALSAPHSVAGKMGARKDLAIVYVGVMNALSVRIASLPDEEALLWSQVRHR